jgi:hypothetical protein
MLRAAGLPLTMLLVATHATGCSVPRGTPTWTGFVLPMVREAASPTLDPAGPSQGPASGGSPSRDTPPGGAPRSADAPSPPAGGGAGASLAQPAPAGETTPGTVLVEGLEGLRPLAGAVVYTRDGRSARTDAAGRFQLPGPPPADGTWVAAAEGFVTSAVTGLPAPPTLHLRERATTRVRPTVGAPETLVLQGLVRDASGRPAPNVLVAVGGVEILSAIPVRTDDQGRWTSRVVVAGGRLTAATVLAVELEGAGVGLARGLSAAAGASDVGTLTLMTTTLATTIAIEAGDGPPATQVELRAVTDDGVSLPLFGPDGTRRAVRLPGVRYALEVMAQDAAGEVRSEIVRPDLPLDWTQAALTWREALLPAPRLTALLADIYPGQELAWQPVPGAGGYLLEVQAVESVPELPWEGFTTDTRLPFLWRGESWPQGAFYVTLRALDAPGLSTRALAAVGPRRLRSWQSSAGWRASFRRVQVQR